MANFNRSLIVTYSDIFGNDFKSDNLSILNKPTWAKIIARLNYLARTKDNYSIKDLFQDWFNKDNSKSANEYWNKIISHYSKLEVKESQLEIINIWSNLTLLDKVIKGDSTDGKQLSNSESENILFENYLATNDLYAKQTDSIFKKITKEDYPNIVDRLGRTTLTLLLPYHELNHFKAIELLIIQFIKSFYLFKFLDENYNSLLKKFLESYELNDWNDYLLSILPIKPKNLFTFKIQNPLNLILLKRRNFIYLTGVGAAASMIPIKVYVSKVR